MKVSRHSITWRWGAHAPTRVVRGRMTRLVAFTLSTESSGLEPDSSHGFQPVTNSSRKLSATLQNHVTHGIRGIG
jgi:hypothetical protein